VRYEAGIIRNLLCGNQPVNETDRFGSHYVVYLLMGFMGHWVLVRKITPFVRLICTPIYNGGISGIIVLSRKAGYIIFGRANSTTAAYSACGSCSTERLFLQGRRPRLPLKDLCM